MANSPQEQDSPQELEPAQKPVATQPELIESNPKPNTNPRSVSRLISSQWSAPLPPPQALQQYDQIVPGAADRILQMAEKAQAHRLECERLAIGLEQQAIGPSLKMGARGQWLGWSLAVIALILAVVCAFNGVPWMVPVALVGVPVLGAVQAIVDGRRERKQREKDEEDEEEEEDDE